MGSSRNWPSSVAAAVPRGSAVCVGFSGGVDSAVLLDLLARDGRDVRALHVHHGLSPNADAWARFCERFCKARGVPLDVERVSVRRDKGEGLEAAARAARYAAYAKRREPYVALAHHLDDQVETVLLQLMRGTGLKGVAAMPLARTLPGSNVTLLRPLLAVSRASILDYARRAGLEWIDDESNAAITQDRNYLRHEIAPKLDLRFPAWRESVARFARHAAQAEALLGARGVRREAGGERAVQAHALRALLASSGLPMPSEARLAEMVKQLHGARPDARVRIEHGGAVLVRHRGEILVERELPRGDRDWRIAWHGEPDLDLGKGRGRVHFERAHGAGIAQSALAQGEWCFRPRAGGEKIRVADRGRTRTLKNLLQEHAMPAWQRDHLPLLFHDNELVWVPGVGIAAGYACRGAGEGLSPSWKVAGRAALC